MVNPTLTYCTCLWGEKNNQVTKEYFPFPYMKLDQRNTICGVKDWDSLWFEINNRPRSKVQKRANLSSNWEDNSLRILWCNPQVWKIILYKLSLRTKLL